MEEFRESEKIAGYSMFFNKKAAHTEKKRLSILPNPGQF
jgi:hypothetical protein